ncbi:hypothetical protein J6T21_01035 [Candidatus Saccharibacteria bacterium]|nr:hypothetical protein [Candidatus Saccharibacteria bacterium]
MKRYNFLKKKVNFSVEDNLLAVKLMNMILDRIFDLNQTHSYRCEIRDEVLGSKDSTVDFEFDFSFGDEDFIQEAEYRTDKDCKRMAITFAETYYGSSFVVFNHILYINFYGKNAQGVKNNDAIVSIIEAIALNISLLCEAPPLGKRYIPGAIEYNL